jgi:hypothetical protein
LTGQTLKFRSGEIDMRRVKPQAIRNKLDLGDRMQVRLVKKRLRLSEPQLSQIVDRVGNSIAAISKEATLQRASRLPESPPASTGALAVAVVATSTESTNTEAPGANPAP